MTRPESDRQRLIMIGAGGMARAWIRRFLPVHADRVEIVALVDIAPEPLAEQGDFLGLPANRRFARMEDAFEAVDADCCAIVIPPAAHRRAVELAAARGLDILSEKPLADSWEDSVAIYRAAKAAGVKMQVMQNYRANPPILTLKQSPRVRPVGPALLYCLALCRRLSPPQRLGRHLPPRDAPRHPGRGQHPPL